MVRKYNLDETIAEGDPLHPETHEAIAEAVNDLDDRTADIETDLSTRLSPAELSAAIGLVAAVDILDPAKDLGAAAKGRFKRTNDWVDELARAMFQPPPPFHVPVITTATAETTALSSPVVYKPAIVDTGAQVNGWDGATSPTESIFRFWPGVYNTANGAVQDDYLYGSVKPASGGTGARWPLVFGFQTAATNSVVEIAGYCSSATGVKFLVEVNGSLLCDTVEQSARTGVGGHMITLTFATAASRRIRIFAEGVFGLREVRVPTGQTLTQMFAPPKKIAVIGDSWVDGQGSSLDITPAGNILETFAPRLVRLLGGIRAAGVLAGIGGSGYTHATMPYSGRVSAVLATNPDIVIVYGSQNDGDVDISAAVTALLTSLSTVPRVIVIPTLWGYTTQTASVRAATLAADREFVDVRGLINGTGYVTAPTGDGNRDMTMVDAGNLHMTIQGHRLAAKAIYSQIMADKGYS